MILSRSELLDHYDFYLENCNEMEIPISFIEWVSEYQNDLNLILNDLINDKTNEAIPCE